MHILDYIEGLPDNPQGALMKYLHHFLSSYPELNTKVMFSTPFYTRNRWMIYLNKLKDGSLEVCFVQANQFSKHKELLDFKKRKQVAGITYCNKEEVNADVLNQLIMEAFDTDDRLKRTSKRYIKRPKTGR